jgi:sec-independent protein translocase protein TatB
MLDVAPTELLLVAAVALIVIGPKDLPNVMRTVGRWVGRARGVASHFRSGFDQMVRDAEMEEMEKRWAAENARIMREHPAPADVGALPAPLADDRAATESSDAPRAAPFDPGGPLDMEPPSTEPAPPAPTRTYGADERPVDQRPLP